MGLFFMSARGIMVGSGVGSEGKIKVGSEWKIMVRSEGYYEGHWGR